MSIENQNWDMLMNIENIMDIRNAIWCLEIKYLTENMSGYFIYKEMKNNIENIQRIRAEGEGLKKANEIIERHPELLTIPEGLVMKYENFDPSLVNQEKALFELEQAKMKCWDINRRFNMRSNLKSSFDCDRIIKLLEKGMEELRQMKAQSVQGNSEQSGSTR